jgi:hypothetical protein
MIAVIFPPLFDPRCAAPFPHLALRSMAVPGSLEHFAAAPTEFGSAIDEIVKQAERTPEDNAVWRIVAEEVERLSLLRSPQFFNAQKAKRWKKIKSKPFRRLHNGTSLSHTR